MTAKTKAEELAEKILSDLRGRRGIGNELDSCDSEIIAEISAMMVAALHEYGAAVRARDVEICAKEFPSNWCDPILTGPDAKLKMDGSCQDIERYTAALKERCAAAIAREPLP